MTDGMSSRDKSHAIATRAIEASWFRAISSNRSMSAKFSSVRYASAQDLSA